MRRVARHSREYENNCIQVMSPVSIVSSCCCCCFCLLALALALTELSFWLAAGAAERERAGEIEATAICLLRIYVGSCKWVDCGGLESAVTIANYAQEEEEESEEVAELPTDLGAFVAGVKNARCNSLICLHQTKVS